MSRVLSELRHTVHESSQHPLDPKELSRGTPDLRFRRRSEQVSDHVITPETLDAFSSVFSLQFSLACGLLFNSGFPLTVNQRLCLLQN